MQYKFRQICDDLHFQGVHELKLMQFWLSMHKQYVVDSWKRRETAGTFAPCALFSTLQSFSVHMSTWMFQSYKIQKYKKLGLPLIQNCLLFVGHYVEKIQDETKKHGARELELCKRGILQWVSRLRKSSFLGSHEPDRLMVKT